MLKCSFDSDARLWVDGDMKSERQRHQLRVNLGMGETAMMVIHRATAVQNLGE